MKIFLQISVLLFTLNCCGQVNFNSGLTIYDNGVIEEIKRVINVNHDIGELTIITHGTTTNDFDTYVISSKESTQKDNQYIYTIFSCVKPNKTQPTKFKFNYVDDTLDNIQVISKGDTIGRLLIDEIRIKP